jgi:hypothetical protein
LDKHGLLFSAGLTSLSCGCLVVIFFVVILFYYNQLR